MLDSRDAFHETNLTYDLHTTSPPERLSNLFLCHRMPAAGSLVFGISRKSQAIHRFAFRFALRADLAAVDTAEIDWHVGLQVSKQYLKSPTCSQALRFGLELEDLHALSLSLSLSFSVCVCACAFLCKYV